MSNQSKGVLYAIVATTIWGSSFIGAKFALTAMNPMSIVFLRFFFASVFFVMIGIAFKEFKGVKFEKKDIKYLIFGSLCQPCLYLYLEIKALQYTTASEAGAITALMPVLSAIFAAIFLKEKLTRFIMIGMAMAFCGAILISLNSNASASAPNPMLGNFLEFCAMICAGGYTIITKYLSDRYSTFAITATQIFGGTIFFLPFFGYEVANKGFTYDALSLSSVLYLAIAVSVIGYGLYNKALSLAPASKLAVIINLYPVTALFFGFLILGEKLNVIQYVSAGLIFLGIIVSENLIGKMLKKDKKSL